MAVRTVPPWVPDAALAAGCWLVFTLPVVLGVRSEPDTASWLVAVVGAAAVVPLVARRSAPAVVAASVAVVLVVAELAGVRFTPLVSSAGPAFGIAVFTLADTYGRRRSLWTAAACTAVVSIGSAAAFASDTGQDHDAVQLLIAGVAWVLGDTVRTRRTHRADLALERDRRGSERDARLRAEERLLLSRDVHDVVSHSLSGIAVRAGVARLLVAEHPEQAPDALAEIETASRTALDEIRGLLTRLREPSTPALRASLAEVDALAAGLCTGGLTIDVESVGTPGAYAPAVETAAFRIVQEALTNVVRHSGARRARVRLEHRPDCLVVSVVDDGGGVGTATPGLGLTGMRERAELLGGSFGTASAPDGGFEVTARLPGGRR